MARSFSPTDIQRKSEDYHGTANFTATSPDLGVKSVNIEVPFEQALKLSLALQSCLQSINRYNRSTRKGRSMGVLLSVKFDTKAMSVIESPIKDGRSEQDL